MTTPRTCPDCHAPITGRAVRCPTCARLRKNTQTREAARRARNHMAATNERWWQVVAAPDMDAWGCCSCFCRGEINVMLEQGAVLDGTVFACVSNPTEKRIVKGKHLRVYIEARA